MLWEYFCYMGAQKNEKDGKAKKVKLYGQSPKYKGVAQH